MVGITKELRESRFYQDITQEGKDEVLAEAVPMLLQCGFSIAFLPFAGAGAIGECFLDVMIKGMI